VIEKVTLAIVIIELATVERTAREPSGPLVKVQPSVAIQLCPVVARSRWIVKSERRIDPTTMIAGMNQKLVRNVSQRVKSQSRITLTPIGCHRPFQVSGGAAPRIRRDRFSMLPKITMVPKM
jgi:hypothetical protein